MSEQDIVNLIKEVRRNFPNEFYETIGYMRGLKVGIEKNKDKLDVQHETKEQ